MKPTLREVTVSRRNSVVIFLLLVFGSAWLYFLSAYLLGFSLVNPLVQLPGAFCPAIAAIIIRRWGTREGFSDAGLLPRWKQSYPYYLVAWFGPFAVVAISAICAIAFGLWQPNLSALNEVLPGLSGWTFLLLLVGIVPLLALVFWGEDFGWNSFLLQRIFVSRPYLAVVTTGLIWATWHYPLAFLGYTDYDNVFLGLILWTINILLQQIVHAWLRIRSRSIWSVSIWHAGNNMVISLLTEMLFSDLTESTKALLVIAPMAIACTSILMTRQFAIDKREC
jgi:uncharacterized protein